MHIIVMHNHSVYKLLLPAEGGKWLRLEGITASHCIGLEVNFRSASESLDSKAHGVIGHPTLEEKCVSRKTQLAKLWRYIESLAIARLQLSAHSMPLDQS